MTVLAAQSARIGSPILGLLIPAAVFLLSFLATWMVYRYFSRNSRD